MSFAIEQACVQNGMIKSEIWCHDNLSLSARAQYCRWDVCLLVMNSMCFVMYKLSMFVPAELCFSCSSICNKRFLRTMLYLAVFANTRDRQFVCTTHTNCFLSLLFYYNYCVVQLFNGPKHSF